MKLTKKLLAILLAVAMLAGMVAVGATAEGDLIQLDPNVPTLTMDDCQDINAETNPYTVRLGFKVYEVDTASGEYTLIADKDSANDIYDVNVKAGSVIRVEIWAQTNFHTLGMQLTPAYTNKWLLPTKMSDYTTFSMKAANLAGKISGDEGFPTVEYFDDTYGAGDGTFEAPIYSNEALTPSKQQTNHHQYNGIKGILPATWKGTGTAANNYYSKTAVDQFGNTIADTDGNFIYNLYQFGNGNNPSGDEAWTGYATVLNVYQPICAFNLTVDASAKDGEQANLFFPIETYYNVASPMTWVQAVDYDAVIASEGANWDPSMPQVVSSGLATYKNKVTYSDGTQADKNWIVTNAVITVGDAGSTEPDTEPSTEETTVTLNYDGINEAIAAVPADLSSYTDETANAVTEALAAANTAKASATTQKELDDAAAALNIAVSKLAYKGADYGVVETAKGKVPADLTLYKNGDAVTAAVNAVVYGLDVTKQAEVNAMAKAIEDAVAALEYKDADYSAVETAKGKVPADLSVYKNGDAVTAAVNAVVYGLDITKQAEVNAMAKAIEDAVAALEYNDADYSAVETAKGKVPADLTLYKNGDAVTAAVNAVVYGLDVTKQAEVNAMAKAIEDAVEALEYKDADYSAVETAKGKVPADLSIYKNGDAVTEAVNAVVYGLDITKQAEVNAMAKAIEDAVAALEMKTLDYTAWDNAVAKVPADLSVYTPDSVAAFAAAKAAAESAKDAAVAALDQAALDVAAADLEEAVALLKAQADKGALADAIAAAKAKNEADYTPDSWAAAKLADAIAAAELVNNDANASDDEVAAALQGLATATAALKEKAVKDDLLTAINTLPQVAEEDAVPATWDAYEAALAAAQDVYDDANATQEAVDAAETELLLAIAGVQEKETVYCDYEDLDLAINAFEDLDADKYTPNSYNAVAALYEAATKVARGLEYSDENQQMIDDAADALSNAIKTDLVERANKDALKAAIDTVVDTANCTSASIANYEAALADANEVYADANATQAAVDAAKDALVAAQNLQKLPKVDYSDLIAAMDQFEDLTEADWTAKTWAVAKDAYDAAADILAEDLYDDEDYVNGQRVDDATDALNTAIRRLVAAVKKDALKAEIDKASSIVEDLATDATWAEYANALANAEEVYADEEATQEDVDDAAAELAAANAALALRDKVDCSALDDALALVPAEDASAYTPASWAAYAKALEAAQAVDHELIDNKAGTNQKLVDDAAAALVAAYNALKINAANITEVAFDNDDYFTPGTLEYAFKVNGAASKIQVLSPDGGTMTFDRRSSRVTIVSYDANGNVVEYPDVDPAYEIWTINLVLAAGDYQVRAKYDYTWDTEYFDFEVAYDKYEESATFTVSAGDVADVTEITVAKGTVLTFKAVTDANATKVRFVFADGGTSTYSKGYAVDNGDGTLTWTITRTFAKSQNINLSVKTPAGWSAEYQGNVVVTIG